MESNQTKIDRLLRTPGIFNWARQNHPREDDTLKEVWRMVEHPPRRSIGPITNICQKLANKKLSYSDATEAAAGYEGYLRMVADEVIPTFDSYLTNKQFEIADDMAEDFPPYPFSRDVEGRVRAIPIAPMFVSIEGDKLVPNFMLAWARPRFSYHQIRLICTVLADGLLSHSDFLGSNGRIIFVRRGKWGGREIETWNVRDYADMSRQEIEDQFQRYNSAVSSVIESLKNS